MKKKSCLFVACFLALSLTACSGGSEASSSMAVSSSPVSSSVSSSSPASSSVSSAVEETSSTVVENVAANLNQTYTLADLTEDQINIFKQVVDESGAVDLINQGLMTIEDMDREQDYLIEVYISANGLPENGKELFREWKEGEGYYDQFRGSTSGTSGTTGTVENGGSTGGVMGGSTAGNSSESTEEVIEVVPPTNTNKPDPSEGQKAEQDEANGEDEGWVTWENKEEIEQGLQEMLKSAGGTTHDSAPYIDPDVVW